MLLGFHKYSLYRPHKLSWTLSQILLIYYPTWVFTKIPIILLPKLGHKIVLSPQKSPNTFTLWEKSKKAQQNSLIKPVATRHLLKACCYTAPLKPTHCYMAPIKSQLLHGISKSPLLHGTPKASPLLHDTSKSLLLHGTS